MQVIVRNQLDSINEYTLLKTRISENITQFIIQFEQSRNIQHIQCLNLTNVVSWETSS